MRSGAPRRVRTALLSASLLVTIAFVPAGSAVAAGVSAFHGAPMKLVTPPHRATSHSTNWSGFAAFGNDVTFRAVRGEWIQPAATCNSTKHQYSSFWIGIDGYNSNSVQQIGTDSDCLAKSDPAYYAWFEMFPAPPHKVPVAIHPGDEISARIRERNDRFRLMLTNVTTGKTFSTVEKFQGALESSAEWIAEAPSLCGARSCKVAPLANFGSVDFTGSYTTGDGHVGSISDPLWKRDRITMVTDSGAPKAVPTPLDPTGTSFTIDWQHV